MAGAGAAIGAAAGMGLGVLIDRTLLTSSPPGDHARIAHALTAEESVAAGVLGPGSEAQTFGLAGPVFVWRGQQNPSFGAPPVKQVPMTSWFFLEKTLAPGDSNVDLVATIWGPFPDGHYSIEASRVAGASTLVLSYQGSIMLTLDPNTGYAAFSIA